MIELQIENVLFLLCFPDLLAEGLDASPPDGPSDESEGAVQPRDTASPASSSSPSGAASSSGTSGAGSSQETDHGPAAEGKGRKRAQKRAQQRERRRAKNQKGAAAKEKVKLQAAAVIVNTRTTVAVLWQDGTKAEGVRGADLFPVEDLGEPCSCLLWSSGGTVNGNTLMSCWSVEAETVKGNRFWKQVWQRPL